jgi:hypothetical protein
MRRLVAMGPWVYAAAVLSHDAGLELVRRLRHASGRHVRRPKPGFEQLAVAAARQAGVDGIICGHAHRPAMRDMAGVGYVNTGDWVDSCTAVVEHADGRLEMLHWPVAAAALVQPLSQLAPA